MPVRYKLLGKNGEYRVGTDGLDNLMNFPTAFAGAFRVAIVAVFVSIAVAALCGGGLCWVGSINGH